MENLSGRALARATIALQPIPGTPGLPRTARTSSIGLFEFLNVPSGTYVLKAAKRGFIPSEYGQKRWNSAGTPVSLTPESSPFLTIRLLRFGAITGSAFDENDIGLPQQEVVAYRNTQPPQVAGRATADERGVYRITGLEPGQYLVRSTGYLEEDTQYLPTFAPQTLRVEQSRLVDVYVDSDSRDADVRPITGKLYTLKGTVEPNPAAITLASDLGRQHAVGGSFEFKSLPAGRYELYAEAKGPPHLAAYSSLIIGGDSVQSLSLQPVKPTSFELSPEPREPQILARRKDFTGVQDVQTLNLANGSALLAPGRWELMLIPPPGQYVSNVFGPSLNRHERWRPDGWSEVTLGNWTGMRFVLSSGAAVVQGLVKLAGEVVAGAPVFLEAYDPNTGRRLSEVRETRTDMRGSYQFQGVVPGAYRVLATFEYRNPDQAAMSEASPRVVRMEAQSTSQVDLDLYVIR